jgi:hypothetical protein
MQQEIYDMDKLSSLVCAQAITDTNLHCSEANKPANNHSRGHSAFYQMQQPYHFEYIRTLKTNKQTLRDALKDN